MDNFENVRKSATPGSYSFSRRFHSHFRLVEFSALSRKERGNSVTISSFRAPDSSLQSLKEDS